MHRVGVPCITCTKRGKLFLETRTTHCLTLPTTTLVREKDRQCGGDRSTISRLNHIGGQNAVCRDKNQSVAWRRQEHQEARTLYCVNRSLTRVTNTVPLLAPLLSTALRQHMCIIVAFPSCTVYRSRGPRMLS